MLQTANLNSFWFSFMLGVNKKRDTNVVIVEIDYQESAVIQTF
jgi:hypothetical protein